jgi:hypothetical protein
MAIKMVNGLPKILEMPLFQPMLLHSLHYRNHEVAYFSDKRFEFCVKSGSPQVIIQVSDEMYSTFLLAASHRIIGRIKI